MPKPLFVAAKIYDNDAFKGLMNKNYEDETAMRASILKLAAASVDMKTMKFGDYQPVLSDSNLWPMDGGKYWQQEIAAARNSLGFECEFLDACVRKCFNSEPPIPMKIDVRQKDKTEKDPSEHSIELQWEYVADEKGRLKPSRLLLTMVCPYGKMPPP